MLVLQFPDDTDVSVMGDFLVKSLFAVSVVGDDSKLSESRFILSELSDLSCSVISWSSLGFSPLVKRLLMISWFAINFGTERRLISADVVDNSRSSDTTGDGVVPRRSST